MNTKTSDEPHFLSEESASLTQLSEANVQIDAADEVLFPENSGVENTETLSIAVTKETFNESVHREYFLQTLDLRRSRHAAMSSIRFRSLVELMKVILRF